LTGSTAGLPEAPLIEQGCHLAFDCRYCPNRFRSHDKFFGCRLLWKWHASGSQLLHHEPEKFLQQLFVQKNGQRGCHALWRIRTPHSQDFAALRSKAPKWLKSTLIRAYELECADQAYLIEAPNDWGICIHIHQIDGCFDTRSNSDVVSDPGGKNDLNRKSTRLNSRHRT